MAKRMQDFLPRRLAAVLVATDKALEVFIVALFLFFVVLTFIQVVLRYVFADSISWADEISRYMFIWMVFMAAGLVVGKGKHICIEVIRPLVSDAVAKGLMFFSDIMVLVFSVFLMVYGWNIIRISFTVIAPATEIPMSYFQMIFLVFGFICVYRSLIHMVLLARTQDVEIE